jgi:uncharacterized membrane protein
VILKAIKEVLNLKRNLIRKKRKRKIKIKTRKRRKVRRKIRRRKRKREEDLLHQIQVIVVILQMIGSLMIVASIMEVLNLFQMVVRSGKEDLKNFMILTILDAH